MGEMKNAYKILIVKTERKRPLEIPRCRWKDDIKMNLKDISGSHQHFATLSWHGPVTASYTGWSSVGHRITCYDALEMYLTSDGGNSIEQSSLRFEKLTSLNCSRNFPLFMKAEDSLLCSQEPATVPYRKKPSKSEALCDISNHGIFFMKGTVRSPTSAVSPAIGCPSSYLPYLEATFSIREFRPHRS
jgi:hypothetical protein